MLTDARCRGSRHHEAQSEWLLYSRGQDPCPTPLNAASHASSHAFEQSQFMLQPARRSSRSKASAKSKSRKSKRQSRNYRCVTQLLWSPSQRGHIFLLTDRLVSQPSVSGFITAVELGHQRKRVVKISTGSKQLDSILGGLVPGSLVGTRGKLICG